MKSLTTAFGAGLAALALAACGGGGGGTDTPSPEETMNNPASAYCEELGGTVDLATGVCTLPDGTQIDEWELYNRDNPS
jgi:putative hemolysin